MKQIQVVFFKVKDYIFGGNQKYKCTNCGQIHSGVYSSTLCQDCYKKQNR